MGETEQQVREDGDGGHPAGWLQRADLWTGLASLALAAGVLVVGADELEAATPSSKLKKARKLQESGGAIEILPEAVFWQRVEG